MHIMRYTGLVPAGRENKVYGICGCPCRCGRCFPVYENKKEWKQVEEKAYKVMSQTGGLNITLGVISIVAGIAGGVLLIVGGARLLAAKSKLLF